MSEGLMCLEAGNKIKWGSLSICHRVLGDDGVGGLIYGRERFGAHFFFPYYYFCVFGGKLHVKEAMG